MRYKSAAALEMAVKSAASASPMDTGRAVSAFYFHRLLCRVFAGGNGSFVLKGGRAMLARTVDARATRDIDLLSTEGSLEDALEELVRLAGTDLGDFVTFEFAGSRPIKAEDEYRSGLSVGFVPMLGAKRMQPVSVDLVVDEVPLEGAERISPADRIEVDGLETCDYLVYPVEAALADKLCGIVEVHGGRASSRVKDLVDIAVYATTATVDGSGFQSRLRRRPFPPGDLRLAGVPLREDVVGRVRAVAHVGVVLAIIAGPVRVEVVAVRDLAAVGHVADAGVDLLVGPVDSVAVDVDHRVVRVVGMRGGRRDRQPDREHGRRQAAGDFAGCFP